MSCYGERCQDREDVDEDYAERVLEAADNRRKEAQEERLNDHTARCSVCKSTKCNSLRWFPELQRYGTCPRECSCRLTATQ